MRGFDLSGLAVQQPANSGALAVLADVAGNAREEMEVATQLKVSLLVQHYLGGHVCGPPLLCSTTAGRKTHPERCGPSLQSRAEASWHDVQNSHCSGYQMLR